MKIKLFNYIGLILLIVIIGIFIHSEIIGHSYNDKNLEQYDYCNLISNTIQPQQNEFQKLNFVFYGLLPSFECFIFYENSNFETFTIQFTPGKNISRIILFESFLI